MPSRRRISKLSLRVGWCLLLVGFCYTLAAANPPFMKDPVAARGVPSYIDVPFESAPVLPNQTLITGIVLEYSIVHARTLGIEPDMPIYRLIIKIESTGAIAGMPDLLKDSEGKEEIFYSREHISPDVFDKRIRAIASYSGDERVGRWWMLDITMP